jgi:hypothetical protein
MAQGASMPVCPMARYCRGMMESSLAPLVLNTAGFVLVALGALIVIWPAVLPWRVAAMVIAVGAGMFIMAQIFRRFEHQES